MIKWTPEMEALLGTKSDQNLADLFGISREWVCKRRNRLEVASFRIAKLEKTLEVVSLLGSDHDNIVAEVLGVCAATVRRCRQVLEIPSFRTRKIQWTEQMDSLLGTESDVKVAERLGLNYGAVFRRRCKLGVAPAEKSKASGPSRFHRRRQLPDTLTYEQWKHACEYFNDCCAYCGKRYFLTEDHLVPLSKGGPRTDLNIIPACFSCNCSKGPKQAHLWIYEHFGMEQGKKIIEDIVAYLTEVQGS